MKKESVFKKAKKIFRAYINGARGAVSLLLVLTMSPLLSVALLLVESARYQDAVELMQEVVDSSAFSALADYDSYLDERFGLLSVSQETDMDINSSFDNYLTKNVDMMGKSVTVNSKSANGDFALADSDVLKQQLLEYSEITVPTELLTESVDLENLMKELEQATDTEEINKEVDSLNAGVDLATDVETLVETAIDVKNQYYDKYSPALTAYQNSYSDFQTKLGELAETLKKAEESEAEETEESEEAKDIYENAEVLAAIENAKQARDDYKAKTATLKAELSTLNDYISTLFASLDSIPAKLQEFDDKIGDSSLAADCTTSTYEWLKIIIDQMTTGMQNIIGMDYKDKVNGEIQKLQEQETKLDSFQNKTVDSSWDEIKISSEYGAVSIVTIEKEFAEKIQSLLTQLDQNAAVGDEAETQMGNMLDIAGELLGISGLYNSSLNSCISAERLYADTTMSYTSKFIIGSITDLIAAGNDFKEGINSLNIIKALKALVELLKAIGEFLLAVITWIGEACVNLACYIGSGPKEWYNNLLLYGYGAYNMPNRTNCTDGKTLSGYSYSNIFDMAGGQYTHNLTGAIADFSSMSNLTGNDKMFKGAEAEYLLVGSTSEMMNQSAAFFDLYLLRLVLDLGPILKNGEVTQISSLAGPGAWVVKLAIILAEPMLDTIILVNGGKEEFLKDKIYFTYSGFVILQNDLVGITAISENLQNKIKDTIKAHNGTPTDDRLVKVDISYTEHMLLLYLLCVPQETYIQRMQNLIQMEAACKHETEYDFELDQAYTYIYSNVKYTLNPMFKLDSLSQNGAFTAESKQYIGY